MYDWSIVFARWANGKSFSQRMAGFHPFHSVWRDASTGRSGFTSRDLTGFIPELMYAMCREST